MSRRCRNLSGVRGRPDSSAGHRETALMVESRCGAVAVGRTYPFPPLSSGGALAVRPWLRFHIPLIEPDVQISRIRLVWAFFVKVSRHFCLPLSFHSFVRPAPPSILPPRPYISIAVGRSGGQGRRFFSAAEGSSLTDASTAAGCRRRVVGRARIRGEPAIGRDQTRTTLVFG